MDGDRNRVTVQEAARRLQVTEQAVRKRIKRGTLDSDIEGNRVYVYLDASYEPSSNPGSAPPDPRDELIRTLQDALAAEREANRENRRLLAAALQMRELEAPEETRQSGGNPDEEEPPQTSEGSGARTAQRRPWWRRLFGG